MQKQSNRNAMHSSEHVTTLLQELLSNLILQQQECVTFLCLGNKEGPTMSTYDAHSGHFSTLSAQKKPTA